MPERRAWTPQQDQALKEIVSLGIKKWTVVADSMKKQYHIFGRTGKQCRQRWHNQLDPSITNSNWSKQEQDVLYNLHNLMGNSWSKISQQIKGRTDNQVKNHFYSTVRKAFRRLNRHIAETKSQKQMKIILLNKLLIAAEDKFDRKLKLTPEVIQNSIELKNKLIKLAFKIEENKQESTEMNSIIQELMNFTKSWKRKKKKGKKEDDMDLNQESVSQIESEPEEEHRILTRQSHKEKLTKNKSKDDNQVSGKQMQQKSQKSASRQLIRRRSSQVQSHNNQSQSSSFRLNRLPSSAFSLHQSQDNDLLMLRKRSSSRSSFSIFGGNPFGRYSEFQMPRAGFNLTESQNNIGSKNLFQYPPEFLIQRLDD